MVEISSTVIAVIEYECMELSRRANDNCSYNSSLQSLQLLVTKQKRRRRFDLFKTPKNIQGTEKESVDELRVHLRLHYQKRTRNDRGRSAIYSVVQSHTTITDQKKRKGVKAAGLLTKPEIFLSSKYALFGVVRARAQKVLFSERDIQLMPPRQNGGHPCYIKRGNIKHGGTVSFMLLSFGVSAASVQRCHWIGNPTNNPSIASNWERLEQSRGMGNFFC